MTTARAAPAPGPLARAAAQLFWAVGAPAGLVWAALSLALLPFYPAACLASLALIAALAAVPVDTPPPNFLARALPALFRAPYDFHRVRLVFQDRAALDTARPHLVAFEPHGVLPTGAAALSLFPAAPLPAGLRGALIGVSSAIFAVPLARHLLWWAGCRPASPAALRATLAGGTSVVLCPSGVREAMLSQAAAARGGEAVFLRQRAGFVRLALEQGAPLVPVFAFGQSRAFFFLRPFIDVPRAGVEGPPPWWQGVVRRIGVVPLVGLPRWRVPITIVVGRPLEAPPGVERAAPTEAQVAAHLAAFIAALRALFEEHKAAAGYPDERLVVL